jgi:hypothetical protein
MPPQSKGVHWLENFLSLSQCTFKFDKFSMHWEGLRKISSQWTPLTLGRHKQNGIQQKLIHFFNLKMFIVHQWKRSLPQKVEENLSNHG